MVWGPAGGVTAIWRLQTPSPAIVCGKIRSGTVVYQHLSRLISASSSARKTFLQRRVRRAWREKNIGEVGLGRAKSVQAGVDPPLEPAQLSG